MRDSYPLCLVTFHCRKVLLPKYWLSRKYKRFVTAVYGTDVPLAVTSWCAQKEEGGKLPVEPLSLILQIITGELSEARENTVWEGIRLGRSKEQKQRQLAFWPIVLLSVESK